MYLSCLLNTDLKKKNSITKMLFTYHKIHPLKCIIQYFSYNILQLSDSRMFASSPKNKSCPYKQSPYCPFSPTPDPHLPAFEPLAASAPRSPDLHHVPCDAS